MVNPPALGASLKTLVDFVGAGSNPALCNFFSLEAEGTWVWC